MPSFQTDHRPHRRPGPRLHRPPLLARPAASRAASTPSTSSSRTRSRSIANALRAGSSFLQAIELVVRESRPPISIEFGRGSSARSTWACRSTRPWRTWSAASVGRLRADGHGDQRSSTGRRQPRRDPRLDRVHDPRAGPDQGRDPHPDGAAAPVGLRRRRLLPFGLAGFIFLAAPKLLRPDVRDPTVNIGGLPTGIIILGIAVLMMMIGFFFIQRIVDIEV